MKPIKKPTIEDRLKKVPKHIGELWRINPDIDRATIEKLRRIMEQLVKDNP